MTGRSTTISAGILASFLSSFLSAFSLASRLFFGFPSLAGAGKLFQTCLWYHVAFFPIYVGYVAYVGPTRHPPCQGAGSGLG